MYSTWHQPDCMAALYILLKLICVWCNPHRKMSQYALTHSLTQWIFFSFLTNEQRFLPSLWSCQILHPLPSFHYTHNLILANCFLSPTWCKLNQAPATVRYTENLLVLTLHTSLIISSCAKFLHLFQEVKKNFRRKVWLLFSFLTAILLSGQKIGWLIN